LKVKTDDTNGKQYYEVTYGDSTEKDRIYKDGTLTSNSGVGLAEFSPLKQNLPAILNHFDIVDSIQPEQESKAQTKTQLEF
jgi:hypothetical protein